MSKISFLVFMLFISTQSKATEIASPEVFIKNHSFEEQFKNPCQKEVVSSGLVLNDETAAACNQIQKSNYANEFNQCLSNRPSILAFDQGFFMDCYWSSQQNRSISYSQCLNNISNLNIEFIDESLRMAAYHATDSQCRQLVSCLGNYSQKGIDLKTREVKACIRRTDLNINAQHPIPPFNMNLLPRKKLCMYNINRQQIGRQTATQNQNFISNYASKRQLVHWNSGPCE